MAEKDIIGTISAADRLLPLLAGVRGRYSFDCNETEVIDKLSGGPHGVAGYAVDSDDAGRLWDVSEARVAGASR